MPLSRMYNGHCTGGFSRQRMWAARIPIVVFGAADSRAGASGTLYNFAADPRLNHTTTVVAGVRAAESAELLTTFFAERR